MIRCLVILLICSFGFHESQAQLGNFGNLHQFGTDSLCVFGDISNSSTGLLELDGVTTVNGDFTNAGTANQDTGLIFLNGINTQSISGNNTFYKLTVENPSGAQVISGLQQLLHTLTLTEGIFETNDSLKLLSSLNLTARIAEIQPIADLEGDITMQRYVPLTSDSYHMICSPVSAITFEQWNDDFITSGFPGSDFPGSGSSLYGYTESTQGGLTAGYTAPTNITNTLVSGKGYWAYLWSKPLTIEVTGAPHKFAQSLPVSHTYTIIPTSNDGWNLVANPYPSDINWLAAGWTKTRINDAIYVYQPDDGVYASFVGGIGANGGTQFIASSQSFWVKANGLFSPNLVATEAVKSGENANFFRQGSDIENAPVIRIRLKADSAVKSDETVLRLTNVASKNWDAYYDAYKLENKSAGAPYIATLINDPQDISINSLPAVLDSLNIPMRVKVPNSGNYSLNVTVERDLDSTNCLFVEDLDNGNYFDLKAGGSYSFYMEDSVSVPRFLIHGNPFLDLGPDTTLKLGEVFILKGPSGNLTYSWSDGSSANSIVVSDTGIYWLEVSNAYGCSRRDSIHVKGVSTAIQESKKTDISVYPNPSEGTFRISGLNEVEVVDLKIFNIIGEMVYEFNGPANSQLTVKLTEHPDGVYMLQLRQGENLKTVRLVRN